MKNNFWRNDSLVSSKKSLIFLIIWESTIFPCVLSESLITHGDATKLVDLTEEHFASIKKLKQLGLVEIISWTAMEKIMIL